jgi:3-hydroxy-9,10-secoandrosta-1,3,5(10)-triene-9,17-dione monooxygenase
LVGEAHEGPPTFLVPVIPAGQFRILRESWGGDLTLGLRASGSQTFVVENAFVPDHMVAPFYNFQRAGEDPEGTPGARLHDNPMYLGLTTLVFTAVISAILVGAAWAALDEFEEVLRTKRTINPPFHERYKSPEFQRVFGEALMQTRSAEVIVLEAGRLYMESCRRWRTGTLYFARNDFLQSGLATQAGRMASECVEQLFYAGGTSGAKRGHRLNRYYRDMATYRTHPIAQYETAAEAMGQAHFDLPMPMLEAVGGARSSKRT